ncbi:MAG: FAD-dependent oxidoreductase [bacterium]|nr:FAD-dependent oxidoreductase [bacterium]
MANKATIIGAGLTGLSTGWKLAEEGYQVVILEKDKQLGGLSGTVPWKGAQLDLGPHKLFSLNKSVLDDLERLLPGTEMNQVQKISKITLRNRQLNYPLATMELIKALPPWKFARIILDYGLASFSGGSESQRSYESFLKKRFGKALYEMVFKQYAGKIWGEPTELDEDLASSRVAIPNLLTLVKNLIFRDSDDAPTHADTFLYPNSGCQGLIESLAGAIETRGGIIKKGVSLAELAVENGTVKKVIADNGESWDLDATDAVISTIPLEVLANNISPLAREAVSLASNLKYRSLRLYYLGIDKPRVMDDQWIFFPEGEFTFTRVSEQKSFSGNTVPPDFTVLTAEEPFDADYKPDPDPDRVIDHLTRAGLASPDELLDEPLIVTRDHAYPVYFKGFRRTVDELLKELDSISNLFTIGRQGAYSYIGMCDCLEIAQLCSKHIVDHGADKGNSWEHFRDNTRNFVVID